MNTFSEGWETFSPHFFHPNTPFFGGGFGPRRPGGGGTSARLVLVREGVRERERGGEMARVQDINVVAPLHVARRVRPVGAALELHWLGRQAWRACRAVCIGATEADCCAGADDATKRATRANKI